MKSCAKPRSKTLVKNEILCETLVLRRWGGAPRIPFRRHIRFLRTSHMGEGKKGAGVFMQINSNSICVAFRMKKLTYRTRLVLVRCMQYQNGQWFDSPARVSRCLEVVFFCQTKENQCVKVPRSSQKVSGKLRTVPLRDRNPRATPGSPSKHFPSANQLAWGKFELICIKTICFYCPFFSISHVRSTQNHIYGAPNDEYHFERDPPSPTFYT